MLIFVIFLLFSALVSVMLISLNYLAWEKSGDPEQERQAP